MTSTSQPYVVLLGITQDAGYPQAGCRGACCAPAWDDAQRRRHPTCAAIVDPASGERWLIDCTPRFPEQLRLLDGLAPKTSSPGLDGIFLTHAHVGHYAGLIHLGCEVMDARHVLLYVMPRAAQFLSTNAPWSLLVQRQNVILSPLQDGVRVHLNKRLRLVPVTVPHRGELSETVAFRIEGPSRRVLYLPDIDGWDDGPTKIEDLVADVDTAYLDGTFFDDAELPGRDLKQVPHPTIVETMERLHALSDAERTKVRFLHFNHTNPALQPNNEARTVIARAGHHVAEQGERTLL